MHRSAPFLLAILLLTCQPCTELQAQDNSTAAGTKEDAPLPVPKSDDGVFPDLAPQTALRIPSWLAHADAALRVAPHKQSLATLYLGGHPIKPYPLIDGKLRPGDADELRTTLGGLPQLETETSTANPPDADNDGIPDTVDVMIGARKTALNGARYQEGYKTIPYPGGDVDREIGVCTDVVVRAMRNAGFDLQKLLYRDMTRHKASYGMSKSKKPNRNIEHRRVRRQIVYFKRHYRKLPTAFDPTTKGQDTWLPGDIVFLDTFPSKPGPDHVGFVSDLTTTDGRPLIINNWTYGFTTRDMDLLGFVPVTHRFRVGLGKK